MVSFSSLRRGLDYSHDLNNIMNGGSDGPDSSNTPVDVKTKMDSKFMTMEQLYEAANRLQNIINVLNVCEGVFSNTEVTRRSVDECIHNVRKIIIPVLSKVALVLKGSVKYIAPFLSIKYVCDRKGSNKKSQLVESDNKRKSPDMQLLDNYNSTGSPQADMTPKQSKRSCQSTSSKNETTAAITLPKPTSGKYYTKPEMVEVLAGYLDGYSGTRANAIKEIIDNEYVPCTSMTIYQILNAHKNKEVILDTEWNKAGRPRLVVKKILAAVEETIAQNGSGRSYGKKVISSMITEEKNKAIQAVGHIPLTAGEAMKPSSQ
jgi:hypothetical protein